MFNFSVTKLTCLLTLCFSTSSFAGLIILGNNVVDIVEQGDSSTSLVSDSPLGGPYAPFTYTYTHNLNDNDFELGTDIATNGWLNINFSRYVYVPPESSQTSGSSFNTSFTLFFNSIRFAVEESDAGSSYSGNKFSYWLKPDALAALNHDGYLDIAITSFRYFEFGDSTLDIDIGHPFIFGKPITPVPEPSTLALIIVGLVGLSFSRCLQKT